MRLGAIATIIGGYAFPSESIKSEKGYRVIRISDFNDSKIVYNKVVRYNGDADLTQYEICERDILMAMTGGTVGKSVFLTELPEKHMLLNQRVAIIRNKYIFDEYLNIVITSPITIDVVNSRKNSTNDNISMVDIYNFLVPVPPTNEQKKIVQKIQEALPFVYTYGKSQEALDKLNAEIFDKLRKSVLQEAIQGKLVPQDQNDEPASLLLERIKEEKTKLFKEGKLKKKDLVDSIIFKGDDNKYYEKIGSETNCIDDEIPFEIPLNWRWARMGTIGDWGSGSTPQRGNPAYYGGDILWLKTGELNNGVVYDSEEKITDKALQECSLRLNKIGDVLIAMYGATIGKVAIAGREMTTNQACCGCTPYQIYNKYLFHFLIASKDAFIKKGEGGAQPNISREKLIHHLIPIPPIQEQYRIVEKLEFVIASIMRR